MKKKGFSILELLIALGLAAAVLAWSYPLLVNLNGLLGQNREQAAADFLAQAKLEEIFASPYGTVVAYDSRTAGAGDFWAAALAEAPLKQAYGQVAVVEAPVGLKTVTITVNWTSLNSGRPSQNGLISQICR